MSFTLLLSYPLTDPTKLTFLLYNSDFEQTLLCILYYLYSYNTLMIVSTGNHWTHIGSASTTDTLQSQQAMHSDRDTGINPTCTPATPHCPQAYTPKDITVISNLKFVLITAGNRSISLVSVQRTDNILILTSTRITKASGTLQAHILIQPTPPLSSPKPRPGTPSQAWLGPTLPMPPPPTTPTTLPPQECASLYLVMQA